MIKSLFLGAVLALATALVHAAPAVLTPSYFNSGAAVDATPLGTRVPLVLVHGLGGSGEGWDRLLQAYAQNTAWRAAFKPYTFRYSSHAAEIVADTRSPRTITALGGALRDALQSFYDKTPADQGFGRKGVVILAHSMGGLVARSLMQEHTWRDGKRGGERVLHLITLGTPHHGSQLADAAFSSGLQTASEFREAFAPLVAEMAWTNFDALDSSLGLCNPWLARLNQYQPMAGAQHGRCGWVAPVALPGFYEKIIAYGARTLQQPDIDLGRSGQYKPGSSSTLLATYLYLYSGTSRTYSNDGLVPMASAHFHGAPIAARPEAYDCDHRYIERGYEEKVRNGSTTYRDWAFCAGTVHGTPASGTANGLAVAGSILGVAGGIADIVLQASQVERVLDWAEQVYPGALQPAGALTAISDGYHYRLYPRTGAYLGVKNGEVYYAAPVTGHRIIPIGRLADYLAAAQSQGY